MAKEKSNTQPENFLTVTSDSRGSNNIFKGICIVTIISLVGKIFGALFKIPLTNIIGSDGMGQYQMVFPIFVFVYSFCSSGVATAEAYYISISDKTKHYAYARFGFYITFFISIVLGLLVFIFRKNIAKIQGNSELANLYVVVAILILLGSLLATIKGILRGKEKFSIYAISEALEQIVKFFICLLFAVLFVGNSTTKVVYSVLWGIVVSIVISTIYLTFYIKRKKLFESSLYNSNKIEKRGFLGLSALVSLSNLIVPTIQFLDTILVVRLLISTGQSFLTATSLFGISRGSIAVLFNLPTLLIYSLEFVLLPNLARINDNEIYNKKYKDSVFLATIILFPFLFVYLFFPAELIQLLYSNFNPTEQFVATKLLRIGGISVLFSGLLQIVTVSLQGKKKFVYPIISLLAGGVFKILFLIFFVPQIGIVGAELSSVLFYLVALFFSLVFARKFQLIAGYNMFLPLFMSLSFCVFLFLIVRLIDNLVFKFLFLGIVGIILGLIYLLYFYKTFIKKLIK